VLVRISVAKRLRDAAEARVRARGGAEVELGDLDEETVVETGQGSAGARPAVRSAEVVQ
jgi:hypothetical protein